MKDRTAKYFIFFFSLLLPAIASGQGQTLTLSDAIEIAQARSYGAIVARLNLMSRYWSHRSYRAELLPSVRLSGGMMEFDRSMVQTRDYEDGQIYYVENNTLSNSLSLSIDQNIAPLGGTLSVQSYLHRLDQFSYGNRLYNSRPIRLSYTQPLFAFNRLKWMKKTEPLKYDMAKRTYLEAMEGIGVDVVGLFFRVLSAQSLLRQAESNLTDRRSLLEIAKKRFEIGTITKSEVLQLELSVLNAEVEAADNTLTLRNTLFSLLSYLRLPADTEVTLLPPYTVTDILMNETDVTERALANSSHTMQQKVSLLESEQSVAQAKASRGLEMQLHTQLGFDKSGASLADAYRGVRDNEIVGLTFSLPIFDWGMGRGRVRMAEADLEANRVQLQQAHEKYLQDLATDVQSFNIQAVQCKNALRAQDIANERYDITKQRFEAGSVTVTDLNTAWQESESARSQYIRLLQSYWSNYYSIRKSTLYDWLNGRDIDADFETIVNNSK
ncbi:MAG: TolC family protein [Bacteroides sp.]|nr:TolC family protein [Bacteroides sp.]